MAKLNFKYGTMNSGKSIDLMRTAYNYEELGYKVLVLKPKIDTKGNDKLNSRVGLERKVDLLIDKNNSILKKLPKLNDIACIFVDEVQFLSKRQIDELFLITKKYDIPVIAYGLRNNFKMEGFAGSRRLLEIADVIEEIKTLCSCGEIARFAGRKVNDEFVFIGDSVLIDGSKDNVKYIPLCGKCYLENVKGINLDMEYSNE